MVKKELNREYKNELFKFNLIPGKTEKEIEELIERDNSTLYTFILIFSGMFIFFVLNLIQIFFIDSRISLINTRITQTDTQISEFDEIKALNGQLVRKSSLLESVLAKDIKISKFIGIANTIVGNNGEVEIYGRNDTGEFTLAIRVNDEADILNIIRRAKEHEEVHNFKVLSITHIDESNNLITFSVVFTILA